MAHVNRIKQFSNDFVVTCSDDNTTKVWKPFDNGELKSESEKNNWALVRTFTGHSQPVWGLEYIDEDTVASGSYDRTIKLWSIRTGETKLTISTGSGVKSLKLLSNCFYLASGLLNGNISVYDLRNGSLISSLYAHLTSVNDFELLNDGLFASSGNDFTIRIWNLTKSEMKCEYNLTGHNNAVRGLKLVSFDILASGSFDTTIKLWNITDRTLIRTLTGHTERILFALDLLINDQTIVSGSWDQTIRIWSLKTGECVKTLNESFLIRTLAVIKRAIDKRLISFIAC